MNGTIRENVINEVCLQPDLNESEQHPRHDEYVMQTPQIPFGQSLRKTSDHTNRHQRDADKDL